MAKNTSASINLVRTHLGLFDQFIKWALSIGRVVVILVELVALTAFLYRFSLDRQIIDFRGKIKQEQAVLTFLKPREEKYRNLQERLNLASQFTNENNERIKAIEDVISFMPEGMSLNSFSLSKEGIRLTADISTISSLREFTEKLKAYEKVESVSIDKIENRPSNALISVTLTIGIKGGAKEK